MVLLAHHSEHVQPTLQVDGLQQCWGFDLLSSVLLVMLVYDYFQHLLRLMGVNTSTDTVLRVDFLHKPRVVHMEWSHVFHVSICLSEVKVFGCQRMPYVGTDT